MAYVYFIQPKNGGPIKIGTSLHPLFRVKQIQANSPVELELKAAVLGSAKLEREYHSRFSKHRLHCEWFEDHDELSKLVAELGLPENLGEFPDYKSVYRSLKNENNT